MQAGLYVCLGCRTLVRSNQLHRHLFDVHQGAALLGDITRYYRRMYGA